MELQGTSHDRSREILHSCTECRQRKAKCDRAQPECGNCSRHSSRSCSYDKPAKTPLTRKYVAELERELAEAQDLLRRSNTPARPTADGHISVEQSGGSRYRSDSEPHQSNVRNLAEQLTNSSQITLVEPAPGPEALTTVSQRSTVNETYQFTHPTAPKVVRYSLTTAQKPSPTFSLEAPPASDDFDWDERNATFNSNADGMASLANGSKGGYLGVASGAALLRLADADGQTTSTCDIGEEVQGDESMQHSPIPKVIYTLSQLEPFVDAYFSLYHVSYPIVHEATFRAQVRL